MKKWEDIVRDKLEGYESALPEGSFAQFQALRSKKTLRPAKKATPWIMGLATAVAAGLAAVLFFRQPSLPDTRIYIAERPEASVAQVVLQRPVHMVSVRVREVVKTHSDKTTGKGAVSISSEETGDFLTTAEPAASDLSASEPKEEVHGIETFTTAESPVIPQEKTSGSSQLKLAPAAGIVAGSGLLAAVVTPFVSGSGILGGQAEIHDVSDPAMVGSDIKITDPNYYKLSAAPIHYFPLKLGLSARVPIADKLYLSSGLDYSMYQSSFSYLYSGERKQYVHYLGIPLRANWVFASGKLFDVYVGAGLEGDICLAAYDSSGNKIEKDGLSLSLQGVGGIQLNVTRHLGLYVEPQLIWRVPSEKNVLQTYRSAHPLMFSATAGLRINIE